MTHAQTQTHKHKEVVLVNEGVLELFDLDLGSDQMIQEDDDVRSLKVHEHKTRLNVAFSPITTTVRIGCSLA